MPFQCWPTVFDAGPTFKPHRVNSPYFLAWERCAKFRAHHVADAVEVPGRPQSGEHLLGLRLQLIPVQRDIQSRDSIQKAHDCDSCLSVRPTALCTNNVASSGCAPHYKQKAVTHVNRRAQACINYGFAQQIIAYSHTTVLDPLSANHDNSRFNRFY